MLKRTIILKLGLFAFSLALIEFGLFHFVYPIKYRRLPRRLSSDAWREVLHRSSSLPGLAYELTPNRDTYSQGAAVRTNSFGMRDDEPRIGADHSLHRIVVIGDSATFGFGVPGGDTYSNVLEKLLNEKTKDGRFEVLNLGVGGYSTREEALVLEHKGIRWDPELVVIGYSLNDPEIDPVQPLHTYFYKASWWQYSNTLRALAQFRNLLAINVLGKGDYFKYLHSHHVKWQSVVEGFNRVRSMAQVRNIPILLLIFPATGTPWPDYPYRQLHQQVEDAAKDSGLFVIDLYDYFARYPPADLMVAPGDIHPNRFGHELTASAIYQWILVNEQLFPFLSRSVSN